MSEANIINALNLGTAKAVLNNEPSSPLGKLLTELIEDVIERLKQALADRNINTSSQTLSQSIAPTEVTLDEGGVSVGVSMEFYWRYVNYGVNGTEVNRGAPEHGPAPAAEQSFSQAILNWIPKRGLALPEEFTSYESFAFVIMRNKIREGQAARPFFEDVVNPDLVQILKEPIEKLLGRSIKLNIVAPWQ